VKPTRDSHITKEIFQTKQARRFRPTALSLAVTSALGASTGALAQDQGPMLEEVVIVGTRASLMRAQAVKMDNTSIVEALSAEDIGKLPDSSIAESLARLPGLAGERVNGRTSGISVRGFKEDFTGTSMNGRELIGIGDNRGVEYDLYPAEIMTGAVVHKSASASLMVQGIGGTVDLQTVRPLNAAESFTLTYTYEMNEEEADNPDIDDTGERYTLAFSQKFFDEKLGVAMALNHADSPNNQRKYGVWGYNTNDQGQILPSGNDTNAQGTVLDRDTIAAVFQWRPTDRLDVTVDYLDIEYSDKGVLRGFIEPFSFAGVTGSGANTSGTQIGANPVLRTDPINKEGDLETIGLNVQFDLTDNWSVMFDYADSEADKFDQRGESYAGLARSGTLDSSELGSREFSMSNSGINFSGQQGLDAFSDPDALQLTGPQVWGGGLASLADQFETDELQANGEPYNYLNAQDGFNNFATFHEELETTRLEVTYHFDDGDSWIQSIKGGVNYSDRYKDKVNKGFFATASSYPFSTSIPTAYREGLTDLTWAGLGNVVAYNGNAPYNDGTYILNDAGLLEPDRLGDTFVVEEKVTIFYAQLDFDTSLFDRPFFGNFGLQYVDSEQDSSGFVGIVGSNARTCDANNDNQVDADCLTSGGSDYDHWLPSVNLSMEIADAQFIRAGYSTTISRARLDQMKASGFVKFDQNIDLITIPNTTAAVDRYGSPWSKSAGNPELEPYEANNYDLSYENYFSDQGYVSVAAFYKDIKNWVRQSDEQINFRNDATNGGADYYVPGFHDRIVDQDGFYGPADIFYAQGDLATPPDYGTFDAFEDGLTGDVTGFEVSANVAIGDFFEPLDGLGFAGSATWMDPELDDGSAIPGMSEEIYALTAYYARGGFEARIAMTDRDEFETYQRGGSNKIETVERQGYTLVDGQISYDFVDSSSQWLQGLRISLQGTNLTDEDEENVDPDTGVVTLRRSFGTTWLLNLHYTFLND